MDLDNAYIYLRTKYIESIPKGYLPTIIFTSNTDWTHVDLTEPYNILPGNFYMLKYESHDKYIIGIGSNGYEIKGPYIRSLYVPFCMKVKIKIKNNSYYDLREYNGPELLFFNGDYKNVNYDHTMIEGIEVNFQEFPNCSLGVPKSWNDWDAQKSCLCLDRTVISFGNKYGDQSIWKEYISGSESCNSYFEDFCSNDKNKTDDLCVCVVEALEPKNNPVNCFGPKCSKDIKHLYYHPVSEPCSQIVCKEIINGQEVDFSKNIDCGNDVFIKTDDGEVQVVTEEPKASMSDTISNISIDVWLLFGASILLLIFIIYLIFRRQ